MRFMMIRKADADTEAGVPPSQALLEAMGGFMGEMAEAGILRGGEGLHGSAQGARVNFSGGSPVVIDGPFAETKELIAGFSIIEVATRAEAVAWASKWPSMDSGGEVEIELRRIVEPEDLGEAFTPELQDAEAQLRADTERRASEG